MMETDHHIETALRIMEISDISSRGQVGRIEQGSELTYSIIGSGRDFSSTLGRETNGPLSHDGCKLSINGAAEVQPWKTPRRRLHDIGWVWSGCYVISGDSAELTPAVCTLHFALCASTKHISAAHVFICRRDAVARHSNMTTNSAGQESWGH
ncbi:hypothetical protein BO82DRAFT_159253 [Aspergillus uvarum CBS 121591]|uniref:Uncharacterized protein n=1 Tax=Aspergillus uvarum CBS 121591 TaxID=1448315 RepID=A0A319C242_9EURO|nr:hypothetical protein BO82DRAFT_159253 [Aspergillus uvarum CBS 121591]PYH78247.1 hypothetical protein BO82DRAFT_159253 [Aspergillus uvarum CBS 121591]